MSKSLRKRRNERSSMDKLNKAEWPLPAGLIALSSLPIVAGVVRLSQLDGGAVTPENARFVAMGLGWGINIAVAEWALHRPEDTTARQALAT